MSKRFLFRERMERESRVKEFDELIAAHVADGKTLRQATVLAMKALGYKGPKTELSLHLKAADRANMDRRYACQREYQKQYRRRVREAKRLADASADVPSAPPDA